MKLARRKLAWTYALLLATVAGAAGMEGYYFLDLTVNPRGGKLAIEWQPQQLFSHAQFRDDAYNFSGFVENSYDAILQKLLRFLAEIDQKRDLIFPDPSAKEAQKTLQVATLAFHLTARDIAGQALERVRLEAAFGLSPRPGVVILKTSKKQTHELEIARLTTLAGYLELWSILGERLRDADIKTPSKEFILDCFYTCVQLNREPFRGISFDHKEALSLLNLMYTYGQREHLGSTFGQFEGGKLRLVRSGHLHFFRQCVEEYALILKKRELGESVTAPLAAYLERMPADFKALALYAQALVEEGRDNEAFRFIMRNRPLYANSPETLALLAELKKKRERERLSLMAKRRSFRRDEDVALKIVSPQYNDFVGGHATLTFELDKVKSPVLQIDAIANNQVVGSIFGPPNRVPFQLDESHRGRVNLKLVAYFKNGTYQADGIVVKPLHIGHEAEVNLATLRVSATQGVNKYLLNLKPRDFAISEGNTTRPIQNFRKDKAPLRVAILIDTSSSMSGEKLSRAQYAANVFLSKLSGEDRAAVYTFDQTVMRLSPFNNRFNLIQPALLTLGPHHSTALYDALILASQDLAQQDGNQVMIVVSDGKDSGSELSRKQALSVLRRSPVMVYSVILNLENVRNKEGKGFLNRISKMTGSAAMEVTNIAGLDRSFNRIYNELSSFYLMDFYSSQRDFRLSEVEVRVRKPGVRAKYSQMRRPPQNRFDRWREKRPMGPRALSRQSSRQRP